MQYDSKRFNVLVRGKHTLFVVAQMDGKRKRDAEKLRLQLANMLSVDAKLVVPNHNYEGLPEGAWFCYRYKGSIPARIRRPSLDDDRHLFCAKDLVLNFIEDEKPVKRTDKVLGDMPGQDAPLREEMAVPMPAIDSTAMLALILEQQRETARQLNLLTQIIGQLALKA